MTSEHCMQSLIFLQYLRYSEMFNDSYKAAYFDCWNVVIWSVLFECVEEFSSEARVTLLCQCKACFTARLSSQISLIYSNMEWHHWLVAVAVVMATWLFCYPPPVWMSYFLAGLCCNVHAPKGKYIFTCISFLLCRMKLHLSFSGYIFIFSLTSI